MFDQALRAPPLAWVVRALAPRTSLFCFNASSMQRASDQISPPVGIVTAAMEVSAAAAPVAADVLSASAPAAGEAAARASEAPSTARTRSVERLPKRVKCVRLGGIGSANASILGTALAPTGSEGLLVLIR